MTLKSTLTEKEFLVKILNLLKEIENCKEKAKIERKEIGDGASWWDGLAYGKLQIIVELMETHDYKLYDDELTIPNLEKMLASL